MKKSKIDEYTIPTLEVQGLEVEQGYANSFIIGNEDIGDLEELS